MRTTIACFLAVAAIGLAACSDETEPSKDSAAGPPTPSPSVAPDPTAYCRAVFDLTAASNEDLGITPETATRKEIAAASRAFFGSDRARGLMDDALATAPAHLRPDTEILVEGLSDYAVHGDLRAVGKRIGDSQERIDRFLEKECPEVVGG